MFFAIEKRKDLVVEFPDLKVVDIGRKLGELWRALTSEEKRVRSRSFKVSIFEHTFCKKSFVHDNLHFTFITSNSLLLFRYILVTILEI